MLDYNQLTSFNSTGLSSLEILSLNNNQLTSFSGTSLKNINELNLYSNQLTSFSAAGMESVNILGLDDNRISSINANIFQTNIPLNNSMASFGSNCLDRSSLPQNIANWLDDASADDWTLRNGSCPPLPSTMRFFGTDGNWNNQANWYYDEALTQGISPKLRPDAADNVIVLSNLLFNTGEGARPATVKTLQVLGDANVAIPIRNGGGYTYTTNLVGDNNDITWTSSDPAVTIAYATPVTS